MAYFYEAMFINMADCGVLAEMLNFYCLLINQPYNTEVRQFMKIFFKKKKKGAQVSSIVQYSKYKPFQAVDNRKPWYNKDIWEKTLCI